MNRKLTVFSNKLELLGVVLVFFSALRADGGLNFWLPSALSGMLLCLCGLGLNWLCSHRGQQFRRSLFAYTLPGRFPPFPKRDKKTVPQVTA